VRSRGAARAASAAWWRGAVVLSSRVPGRRGAVEHSGDVVAGVPGCVPPGRTWPPSPERSTNTADGAAARAHARVMSMSVPFQPNLPEPSDAGDVVPDDDLTIDGGLAADDRDDASTAPGSASADEDLDVDGTPVAEGESGADDDLADLPENPLFRTPEPGERLSPDDLEQ